MKKCFFCWLKIYKKWNMIPELKWCLSIWWDQFWALSLDLPAEPARHRSRSPQRRLLFFQPCSFLPDPRPPEDGEPQLASSLVMSWNRKWVIKPNVKTKENLNINWKIWTSWKIPLLNNSSRWNALLTSLCRQGHIRVRDWHTSGTGRRNPSDFCPRGRAWWVSWTIRRALCDS